MRKERTLGYILEKLILLLGNYPFLKGWAPLSVQERAIDLYPLNQNPDFLV